MRIYANICESGAVRMRVYAPERESRPVSGDHKKMWIQASLPIRHCVIRAILYTRLLWRVLSVPRPKGFQAAGKMRVLVLVPEIEKALAGERSLKGFYEVNKGRLNLSYSQLCRYVRALGVRENIKRRQGSLFESLSKEKAPVQGNAGVAPVSPGRDAEAGPGKFVYLGPPEPEKYRDFHFDPMDAYRKKWD